MAINDTIKRSCFPMVCDHSDRELRMTREGLEHQERKPEKVPGKSAADKVRLADVYENSHIIAKMRDRFMRR